MYAMANILEVASSLVDLGSKIRALRIAKGDSQSIFAARLGVSRQTIAAIERGESTVQVGYWLGAWWALSRLESLRDGLSESISLFDLRPPRKVRLRAKRKDAA